MSATDPNELIRELLRISRELQSYAVDGEDEAPASLAFLRGRRDMLLTALRAHMRRYERSANEDANAPEALQALQAHQAAALPAATFLQRERSGLRTRGGAWAAPTPVRSRRKGRP